MSRENIWQDASTETENQHYQQLKAHVQHDDEQIYVSRKVYDQYCFDEEYGYKQDNRTDWQLLKRLVEKNCCIGGAQSGPNDDDEDDHQNGDNNENRSKQCKHAAVPLFAILKRFLFGVFPILTWLPRYDVKESLFADLVAGITVGIMHIPQGMAYAALAGLPPVYGMYTSFFPSLIYTFFGTSAHISLGTIAVASLLTGSVRYRFVPDAIDLLSPNYNATVEQHLAMLHHAEHNASTLHLEPTMRIHPVVVVSALSFLVGVLQILFGVLRAGFLISYLSDQLIAGFTTGTAFIIMASQFDKLFGVKINRYEGTMSVYYTFRDVLLSLPSSINWVTTGISLFGICAILLVKVCINDRYKNRLKVPIPIDLFVIIAVTLASTYADIETKYHVKIVKTVPKGLPTPAWPAFQYMPQLFIDALPAAIIIYALSVSMAQIFAKRHRYRIDPNQEMYAYGIISLIGSFFSAWPAGASLSRSCVQESAGSKTQATSAIASVVVLIVLLWMGPLFQPLPMCVLSAIVVVALKGLICQLGDIPRLWRISRIDCLIFIVAFLATIIFDATLGLAISTVFASFTIVFRSQRPRCLLLGKIPNTDLYKSLKRYTKIQEIPGVKIFRFDTALHFANSELFRKQLYAYIQIDFHEMRDQIAREEKEAARERQRQMSAVDEEAKRQGSSAMAASNKLHSISAFCQNKLNICPYFKGRNNEANGKPHVFAPRKVSLTLSEAEANGAMPKESWLELSLDLKRGSLHSCQRQNCSAGDCCQEPPLPPASVAASRIEALAREINPNLPHHIIIDCRGFNYVDVTGVNMLIQVYRECKEIDVSVLLANCKATVRKMFELCDFYCEVPKCALMLSVEDAVMVALRQDKRTRDRLHSGMRPIQYDRSETPIPYKHDSSGDITNDSLKEVKTT